MCACVYVYVYVCVSHSVFLFFPSYMCVCVCARMHGSAHVLGTQAEVRKTMLQTVMVTMTRRQSSAASRVSNALMYRRW